MDELEDYFWRQPTEIQTFYQYKKLGYVNMTCVFLGIIQYILGMATLLQKHMITPINVIFMHYGSSLMLASFSYVPRTYHELFRAKLCAIPEHNSYTWEMISYCSLILAITFRHCAVWLALMMAIWRYIAIIHPLKDRQYCNMKITMKFIYAGYIFVPFTSLPFFFGSRIGPAVKLLDENGCLTTNFTIGHNVTIYEFQIPIEDYPVLFYLTMGSLGIVVKLLPSFILTSISVCLIKTLIDARKHRREMVLISGRRNTYNSRMERQIRQQTERITIILVIILALFAVGEVPHGICGTLILFYGPKFMWGYWYPAMEMINSLTYFSEMFNFPIYYSMSREFRETFKTLFLKRNSKINITATPSRSGSSLPNINESQDISNSRSSSITTIGQYYTPNKNNAIENHGTK